MNTLLKGFAIVSDLTVDRADPLPHSPNTLVWVFFMKISLIGVVSGSVLVSLGAPALAAAQSDPLQSMFACRDLPEAERLACYDNTIDALRDATDSGEVAIVTPQTLERAERQAFGLGFSVSNLPLFNRGDDSQDTPSTQSARATGLEANSPEAEIEVERNDAGEITEARMQIASYREHPRGYLIFVMENGQVWRQTDSATVRMPRGDGPFFAVITPASLGSYMMNVEGRRSRFRVVRDQ